MSARVAKLEALLTRIQQRAEQPRPLAVAAPSQDEPAISAHDTSRGEMQRAEVLSPADEFDDIDHVPEVDDVQEIDDVELDEPGMPVSGPVLAAEQTIDDAIDDADDQAPVTPPPESGEELTRPHIPVNAGPTMEQLGQTIALEEGGPQDFELDEPTLDEPTLDEPSLSEPPSSYKQSEALTSAPPSDDDLTLPEGAREELDRIRLGDPTPIEARVSSRPVISTNVVELLTSSREFAPKSFLELLEASLKLK